MHIDFSEITDFVQGIGLLNTGFVVLADEDGNILVNNDNNKYVTDSVSGLIAGVQLKVLQRMIMIKHFHLMKTLMVKRYM